MKFQLLLLYLAFFTAYCNAKNFPVPYKCVMDGNKCTFSDVILDEENLHWKPVADHPSFVREITFINSRMPIFGNEICEMFPYLDKINVDGQGVEEVTENAFQACTQLTWIDITNNKIKQFYPNTFKNLTKLTALHLWNNQIAKLDDHLFNDLVNLEGLFLHRNNLTKFSPELVQNKLNLESLWLAANDLSDIEAEKIVAISPKLSRFLLDDNEISCTRAVQIFQLLQNKNIDYEWRFSDKVRYYPQLEVYGGLKCNPDISWMAANVRKHEDIEIEHRLEILDSNLKKLTEFIKALLRNKKF